MEKVLTEEQMKDFSVTVAFIRDDFFVLDWSNGKMTQLLAKQEQGMCLCLNKDNFVDWKNEKRPNRRPDMTYRLTVITVYLSNLRHNQCLMVN